MTPPSELAAAQRERPHAADLRTFATTACRWRGAAARPAPRAACVRVRSIGRRSFDECGTGAERRSVSERDVEGRRPDGRYLVVRGRLWRATNPHLPEPDKERLVAALMNARRQLRGKRAEEDRAAARAAVDTAKLALGERGPVWWDDGEPDFNRRLVRNTPYAVWYAVLKAFA